MTYEHLDRRLIRALQRDARRSMRRLAEELDVSTSTVRNHLRDLEERGVEMDGRWNTLLAGDYARPQFHISFMRAVGRRLRKNYAYILAVQAVAYYGKLAIHPDPAESFAAFLDRAAIGVVPGLWVVLAGVAFHGAWVAVAVQTWRIERLRRAPEKLIAIA